MIANVALNRPWKIASDKISMMKNDKIFLIDFALNPYPMSMRYALMSPAITVWNSSSLFH